MKKILGIGNALVDIMVPIDNDQILSELELPKGSMQLVDKVRSNRILERLKGYNKSQSAGGSLPTLSMGWACLVLKPGLSA